MRKAKASAGLAAVDLGTRRADEAGTRVSPRPSRLRFAHVQPAPHVGGFAGAR